MAGESVVLLLISCVSAVGGGPHWRVALTVVGSLSTFVHVIKPGVVVVSSISGGSTLDDSVVKVGDCGVVLLIGAFVVVIGVIVVVVLCGFGVVGFGVVVVVLAVVVVVVLGVVGFVRVVGCVVLGRFVVVFVVVGAVVVVVEVVGAGETVVGLAPVVGFGTFTISAVGWGRGLGACVVCATVSAGFGALVSCTVVNKSSLFRVVVGVGAGRRCVVATAPLPVVVILSKIGFTASLASASTGRLVGLALDDGRGFDCVGFRLIVGRRVIKGLGRVVNLTSSAGFRVVVMNCVGTSVVVGRGRKRFVVCTGRCVVCTSSNLILPSVGEDVVVSTI